MLNQAMLALIVIISRSSSAGNAVSPYEEAKATWQRNQSSATYQEYLSAFVQFSNHFHLDEKDNCFALAKGSVNLMLVVTHAEREEFAQVSDVLSDVDNAKSRCFKKSYLGVQTKIPPFFPFVMKLSMR